MTGRKPIIRYDIEGRGPLEPVAKPRTITLDVEKLREVAQRIWDRRSDAISDDDRKAMEVVIASVDDRLPVDYNRHPVFVAGALLRALGTAARRDAKKKLAANAESEARAAMEFESATAWSRKK